MCLGEGKHYSCFRLLIGQSFFPLSKDNLFMLSECSFLECRWRTELKKILLLQSNV